MGARMWNSEPNSLGTVPGQADLSNALTNISFADTSLLGFGPGTGFPQGRIVNTYQFLQDNWNYLKGRHQLKAGVNFTYQHSPNHFPAQHEWQLCFQRLERVRRERAGPREHCGGQSFARFPRERYIPVLRRRFQGDQPSHPESRPDFWSYDGQPANLFHKNDLAQQNGSDPIWDPSLPAQPLPPIPKFPHLRTAGVRVSDLPGVRLVDGCWEKTRRSSAADIALATILRTTTFT